jgi:hypothetical protein
VTRARPTTRTPLRRLAPAATALGVLVFVTALVGGGLVPAARAAGPDKSDVVLEFDFSASITSDKANRTRFAAALNAIAARVVEIQADLIGGDTTVSLIQFARRARDVPGCVDLHLLNSPATVTLFSNCLKSVAHDYLTGGSKALTAAIGVDTNYVAALQQAATHIPAGSVRPVIVFFTDGKHDVPGGPPVSQVVPTRDNLFANLPSFALLPVGMGLDPKERPTLEAGLRNLATIRGIPDCVGSGAALSWPSVVFPNAAQAGGAVAQALADATCTFTAAPTPSPTPVPLPPSVSNVRLTPGDGEIDLVWTPAPVSQTAPVIDYLARCRAGDNGDWIQSTEGVSVEPRTTVSGLTNGTAYSCEVASVSKDATGAYVPANATATPTGPPGAPAAPTVTAGAGTLLVSIGSPDPNVTTYSFECSNDGGQTWTPKVVGAGDPPTGTVSDVANGTSYVCRAYAENAIGVSGPSAVSDAAQPCSGIFQCNPVVIPVVGGVGLLLLLALLLAFVYAFRGRQSGHVVAVVDVVHTANIGHGSNLGIAFVQSPETKRVTGIVSERGKNADVRIRRLSGGRFEVRDKTGTRVVESGDPVVVADAVGGRHSLELRAFSTNAASRVATRR